MNILARLWHRIRTTEQEREDEFNDDIHRLERAKAYLALAQLETDIALRRERALSAAKYRDNEAQRKEGRDDE